MRLNGLRTHPSVRRQPMWRRDWWSTTERRWGSSLTQVEDEGGDVRELLRSIDHKVESAKIKEKVDALQQQIERQDLWDDPANAAKITQRHAALVDILQRQNDIKRTTVEVLDLSNMAVEEGESSVIEECVEEIRQLKSQAHKLYLTLLLNGPADHLGCFVEIVAGAGGLESCDWANMLLEMYQKWAEKNGFTSQVDEVSPNPEAGIRNAILRINGVNAYGWTKAESGVHRMVRISEYDSQGRRQTCFAQVRVMPQLDEDSDLVEVKANDLKIETYRSSGAGGQHVNTTESAVRITHLLSGISVQSQAERSQHSNRKTAMDLLRSRLYEAALEKKRQERMEQIESFGHNTWGNQIRSYILHPYKLVKDHRTNHETPQAQAVLNGDPEFLTPFMEAVLLSLSK